MEMAAAGIVERVNRWAQRLYRTSPERQEREEPLRVELLRRMLTVLLAMLAAQALVLLYMRVELFWFLWTTIEPGALLLLSTWCARRGQTHLATMLLLVATSHIAAFLQGRFGHLEFTGVLLVPTIVMCGLLVGDYFVVRWTAICWAILLWVAWALRDGRRIWLTAAAWCAIYVGMAWLVRLFSGHLERLLNANRAAEEQQRAAIVAERTRFAREIHDTLAQGFTGIMMQLNAVAQRMESDPAHAREHLETARRLARESLEEARRSAHALRPEPLRNGDLLAAIEQAGRQLTWGSGIAVDLQQEGRPYALSSEQEVNLLRIAQEALTNAVRHSRPTRIGVRLDYRPQSVVLEVRDDGCGIAESRPGFGLKNMSERAQQIGGEFRISSEPGQGTQIIATVPTA